MSELFSIPNSVLSFLIVVLIIGVIYLYIQLKKSRQQQEETDKVIQQYEAKYNKIQLQNIEWKLNPHLFKNILNSIQSHAYQTYYAMDKLSNVLDYILYESSNKYVTPKEEVEFALSLIEINKIKVSPLFDLTIKSKIDESEPLYEQLVMAPLITIDLIENAFKHADLQSPDSFISVSFEFKNGIFSMIVSNKISQKSPLKKERSGIGMKTFEQRLNTIYKGCYGLERYIENNVFIAHLTINLYEYKDKMSAVG